MKALISPIEIVETGYRVAEVAPIEFPISPPFFWIDCQDDTVADEFWYNPLEQKLELKPKPVFDDTVPPRVQPLSEGAQTL